MNNTILTSNNVHKGKSVRQGWTFRPSFFISMPRYLSLCIIAFFASAAFAQYTGDGYYRVHNKATSRYIYVLDNTGKINVATTSADMGAIELHKDTARLHYDPACIIYAQKVSTTDDIFDLHAQGTGVHDIIGYYVTVYQKAGGYYQVYAEGKYLCDNETSRVEDGQLGTERTGDYRNWYINEVNNTDQYFGILPTVRLGNKYYKPFFASFPFSVVSSGMKVYYISEVHNSAAIISEATGVIPASTPVFIECSTQRPWQNKIAIGGTATASVSSNKLKGNYFNNPDRQKSRDARVAYNPVTMRTLSVTPDGKLCFVKNTSLSYLSANEAYLPVPSTADDTLRVMTAAEYIAYTTAASITLDRHSITLQPDLTATLTPTILPATTLNKTVTWTSSNPSVATVSDGYITAFSVGSATITATTTDGSNLSDTCHVTVNPVIASGLTLSRGLFSGIVGDTTTLTATCVPANTTNQTVTWTTSNPAVATVSDGFITLTGLGSATITAATTDGSNLTATCMVVVNPTLASSITLSADSFSGIIGDTTTLRAAILPDNVTSRAVTWTTYNASVATVTNGFVTLTGIGTATVTAATTDGSNLRATCSVTVNPVLVSSIEIAGSSGTPPNPLRTNDKMTLSATVFPANATNKSVTWESLNTTSLRIVSQTASTCTVQALAPGEIVITATATDGSGISAQYTVTVLPTLAESLTLAQDSVLLSLGDSLLLPYTLLPAETTDKSVVWISSDTTVLTVSGQGLCRTVGAGNAMVTIATLDGSGLSDSCFIQVVDTFIPPVLAQSLVLSRTDADIFIGDTLALTCTVLPLETWDKSVLWTSSDTTVLTVDSLGICRSLAVGSAVISVTILDGSDLTASCSVTVNPVLAESITLSLHSRSLHVGDTFSLACTVLPDNATDPAYVWVSSDASVVTVDSLGHCTALSLGSAVITATTLDGSALSDSCFISVNPILADTLTISLSEATLHVGDTLALTCSVLPLTTTNPSVRWTSSDPTVVTVDTLGRCQALALGVAQISVSTLDGSALTAFCSVLVAPVLADSLILTPDELTLTIGDSATLTAQVFPLTTTNPTVHWQSSAPGIVRVDNQGRIWADGVGDAIITASTADGSSLIAECYVLVEPVWVTSIVLSADSIALFEDENATLTATVFPANATFPQVEWASLDETVATVSAEGRVTGVKPGTTTIIVTALDGSDVTAECKVVVTLFDSLLDIMQADPDSVRIYDLLGRPLSTIHTSGFYIVNGKTTYIVK